MLQNFDQWKLAGQLKKRNQKSTNINVLKYVTRSEEGGRGNQSISFNHVSINYDISQSFSFKNKMLLAMLDNQLLTKLIVGVLCVTIPCQFTVSLVETESQHVYDCNYSLRLLYIYFLTILNKNGKMQFKSLCNLGSMSIKSTFLF